MAEQECHGNSPENATVTKPYIQDYLDTYPAPPVEFVKEGLPSTPAIIDAIKAAQATGQALSVPIFDFGLMRELIENPNGDFTVFYKKMQPLPSFATTEPLLKRQAIGDGPGPGYYYGESGPLSEVGKMLGVLPRTSADNFLIKREGHPNGMDVIYNVSKITNPEFPNAYWHEFVELGSPESYYERSAVVVTVNNPSTATNERPTPFQKLRRVFGF